MNGRYEPKPYVARETNCKVCSKFFTMPYDRRKAYCSPECKAVLIEQRKQNYKDSGKYTAVQKKHRESEKRKTWYEANRKNIIARQSAWLKIEKLTNPELRIRCSLRSRLVTFVSRKRIDRFKRPKSSSMIGCTFAELKAHIESLFQSGMSWSNYGLKGWHIDHIRPMNSFTLVNPDGTANEAQIRAAMHFSNLQPLWAADNIRKSDSVATA